MRYDLAGKRVWIAGHRGMVGAALQRRLANEDCEIISVDRAALDLRHQTNVEAWVARNRPQAIFIAAATVGGIFANDAYPAEFLYDNMMIAANIIEAARRNNIEKLLYLGSSCIYPKLAPQPIPESAILGGPLEPTNQWYAIAKIAGIKLCAAYRRQWNCNYISAMPTNLYGPGDSFDPQTSHVLPALLLKAHRAKIENQPTLAIWGTGRPRREFLHVDDCADALVRLMQDYEGEEHINVGSGDDLTILDLAHLICSVVGYQGEIVRDTSKPDGTPRKLMDSSRLRALGWRPRIALRDGISETYRWFCSQRT